MPRSENEEEYDAVLLGEEKQVRSALLHDPIRVLEPSEAILVRPGTTVREAIRLMKDGHQGAVVVVDDNRRLVGIFSERDVLKRVIGADLDPVKTPVAEVMTKNPIALRAEDKIAFALNQMSVGGFRNIPIIDAEGRAVGIVFMRHFINFIVSLFPDAVLNLPPTRRLKHPNEMYGG